MPHTRHQRRRWSSARSATSDGPCSEYEPRSRGTRCRNCDCSRSTHEKYKKEKPRKTRRFSDVLTRRRPFSWSSGGNIKERSRSEVEAKDHNEMLMYVHHWILRKTGDKPRHVEQYLKRLKTALPDKHSEENPHRIDWLVTLYAAVYRNLPHERALLDRAFESTTVRTRTLIAAKTVTRKINANPNAMTTLGAISESLFSLFSNPQEPEQTGTRMRSTSVKSWRDRRLSAGGVVLKRANRLEKRIQKRRSKRFEEEFKTDDSSDDNGPLPPSPAAIASKAGWNIIQSTVDMFRNSISRVKVENESARQHERLIKFLNSNELDYAMEYLEEHDVKSIAAAKRLSMHDLKKMGMGFGDRSRFVKIFSRCPATMTLDSWDCVFSDCYKRGNRIENRTCVCSRPRPPLEAILRLQATLKLQRCARRFIARCRLLKLEKKAKKNRMKQEEKLEYLKKKCRNLQRRSRRPSRAGKVNAELKTLLKKLSAVKKKKNKPMSKLYDVEVLKSEDHTKQAKNSKSKLPMGGEWLNVRNRILRANEARRRSASAASYGKWRGSKRFEGYESDTTHKKGGRKVHSPPAAKRRLRVKSNTRFRRHSLGEIKASSSRPTSKWYVS